MIKSYGTYPSNTVAKLHNKTGSWFNIKMFYRSSYLHNWNSCIRKTVSSYWISPIYAYISVLVNTRKLITFSDKGLSQKKLFILSSVKNSGWPMMNRTFLSSGLSSNGFSKLSSTTICWSPKRCLLLDDGIQWVNYNYNTIDCGIR